MAKCGDDLSLPKLVNHGDLHVENILWKNNSNDVEAFIDFAESFEGNPMYDIAKILTCTDAMTRRKVESELVESYCDYLKNNIDLENAKMFNVEKLRKAYGMAQVYTLFSLAICAATNKEVPNGVSKEEHEIKFALNLEKTKFAMEDAIKFLEKEVPEWIK
uniref:CHK kinase-like domain-containing protein n=1 Tax=Acrobeloides nanus TaxID=290746 RepID=A0A914DIT9_9BILA